MIVWPLHAPANRANYPGLDIHGAGKPPTQIDPPKAALNIYIYSPYKSPFKEKIYQSLDMSLRIMGIYSLSHERAGSRPEMSREKRSS